MAGTCPTPEGLAAALRSRQPDGGDAELAAHIADCPACQQRLEALSGGLDVSFKREKREQAARSPLLEQAMAALERGSENTAQPVPDPLVGAGAKLRYFGDYEILEELGRGGMGIVYRARQVSLNRFVALKLILAGQLASELEVRRFRTEAEAAAMLDHPNIVPIYEIGEHEGRHYFSMKLIEGENLAEAISRSGRGKEALTSKSEIRNPKPEIQSQPAYVGRYESKKTAKLMAQIARAVHYAHQRGILHRDLKPSNILLDAQGQPHLTDFGLAKMLDRDSGLTFSAAIMGTPNYIAPEVAAGKAKEVTTAADVHSLGAILYELLTGRPPFQEETVTATLDKVRHTDPPSPLAVNPDVPRDLATICLKCLEKEPARRYRSAELLADELDRFASGEPILARPSTTFDRAIKWTKRKPALAGSLLALLLVFVLGFAGILWKWRGEVHHRRLAQQESRRAQQAVTRLEIERAESLLQAGDSSKGLAYLARLLRQQPTNRIVAERLMNALTYRSFCLPVAPLRHGRSLDSLTGERKQKLADSFAFRRPGSLVMANFSPDGWRVVTASKDGTARIWKALTGEPVGEPMRHDAEILWSQFSEDGQRIVTASVDGSARIWRADTGQLAVPLLRHDDIVHFASFSADGQRVVTASRDKTVRVWNARTGQPMGAALVHPEPAVFACFSPDGRRILSADESGQARLWDDTTRATIGTADQFCFPQCPAPFPRFSPLSGQMLTLIFHYAYLWNTQSNLVFVARLQHDNYLTGATYSADGRRIATVSTDSTARIWDARTGESFISPLRHDDVVSMAGFSADGQRLVTSSHDKSARLWEVRTGQVLTEPMRQDNAVLSAKIGAGGQRIVTVSETDNAWLWDVRLQQPLVVLRWLEPPIAKFARFSPDGRRLIVVDEADDTSIWNAQSGLLQTKAMRHVKNHITSDARFSPDGRLLVTTSEDRTAQVWDASTGEPMGRPLRHGAYVAQARFSPDGKRLATCSNDGTGRLWNVDSSEQQLELKHTAHVVSIEFSPNGKLVVTASADATARIWDAESGLPRGQPLQHDANVFAAVFDPGGQRVATASKDKTVRIWSVETGQMLIPPLVHANALNRKYAITFNPDGSRLATMAGNSVQVWNSITGRSMITPLRHGGLMRAVQFSLDGRKLLTASEDSTARLWDPETGHAVSEPMRHGGGVISAEFSPDGTQVLTCSLDNAVRIWEVSSAPLPVPEWMPALAEALAGQRIDAQDVSEVLSVDALYGLRQKLVANIEQTHYGRWARWFFADSASRTISLSSEVTAPEYVRRRIEDNTRESLQEATGLSATNASAFARLAQRLIANPAKKAMAGNDAEWFSRYATNLAPNDMEILQIRASVLKSLSRTNSAEGTP